MNNTQLNFTCTTDTKFNNLYAKGFSYYGYFCFSGELQDFNSLLTSNGFSSINHLEVGRTFYSTNESGTLTIVFTEEDIITQNRHLINFSLFHKEDDCAKKFIDSIEKILVKNKVFAITSLDFYKINYIYLSKTNTIESNFISIRNTEYDSIRPELYPDIDIPKLADRFTEAKENLLLLLGKPGIGKTSFIKYYIAYTYKKYQNTGKSVNFTYVNSQDILDRSDFWSMVIDSTEEESTNKANILILDDLDLIIEPRNDGNRSKFMTQVLSYTDGVFSQKSNKILLSSNRELHRVDEALTRPGRCFDSLLLNPLSYDEAISLWVNLLNNKEEDFAIKFKGFETVTQAELMSFHQHMHRESTPQKTYMRKNVSVTFNNKVGF